MTDAIIDNLRFDPDPFRQLCRQEKLMPVLQNSFPIEAVSVRDRLRSCYRLRRKVWNFAYLPLNLQASVCACCMARILSEDRGNLPPVLRGKLPASRSLSEGWEGP
jgi:hypothetical protein